MSTIDKLTALRERTYNLGGLPDTVLVPALAGRRDQATKFIEAVTLDDIAFALLALNEQSSALYHQIDALRTVYDMARKNGAVGSDTALDAISVEMEGK